MDGALCPACNPSHDLPLRPTRQQHDSPIGAALGLYFALLATFVFMVVSDGPGAVLFVDAVDAVIVLVFVIAWRKRLGNLLRPPENPSWWAYAVLLAGGTYAVTTVFVHLVNGMFTGLEAETYSGPYLEAGYGWHWVVLSICIQPAIVEEFAFRGVIMQALQRVMSPREVLIVSALMFTVLHVTVLSFPALFMIGLVLGWVRMRSKSIWPCVVLHACHNGFVLLEEVILAG